jgi:hypothetical protein
LERIYVYLDGEIGTTRAGGSVPLQDRLAVAEFGLFESQVEALRNHLMDSGEAITANPADMEDDDENWRIDSNVLLVLVDQLYDFNRNGWKNSDVTICHVSLGLFCMKVLRRSPDVEIRCD